MKKKKDSCIIYEIERQKGRRWNRWERDLLADIGKERISVQNARSKNDRDEGELNCEIHIDYIQLKKEFVQKLQEERKPEDDGELEEREVRNLPPQHHEKKRISKRQKEGVEERERKWDLALQNQKRKSIPVQSAGR